MLTVCCCCWAYCGRSNKDACANDNMSVRVLCMHVFFFFQWRVWAACKHRMSFNTMELEVLVEEISALLSKQMSKTIKSEMKRKCQYTVMSEQQLVRNDSESEWCLIPTILSTVTATCCAAKLPISTCLSNLLNRDAKTVTTVSSRFCKSQCLCYIHRFSSAPPISLHLILHITSVLDQLCFFITSSLQTFLSC